MTPEDAKNFSEEVLRLSMVRREAAELLKERWKGFRTEAVINILLAWMPVANVEDLMKYMKEHPNVQGG